MSKNVVWIGFWICRYLQAHPELWPSNDPQLSLSNAERNRRRALQQQQRQSEQTRRHLQQQRQRELRLQQSKKQEQRRQERAEALRQRLQQQSQDDEANKTNTEQLKQTPVPANIRSPERGLEKRTTPRTKSGRSYRTIPTDRQAAAAGRPAFRSSKQDILAAQVDQTAMEETLKRERERFRAGVAARLSALQEQDRLDEKDRNNGSTLTKPAASGRGGHSSNDGGRTGHRDTTSPRRSRPEDAIHSDHPPLEHSAEHASNNRDFASEIAAGAPSLEARKWHRATVPGGWASGTDSDTSDFGPNSKEGRWLHLKYIQKALEVARQEGFREAMAAVGEERATVMQRAMKAAGMPTASPRMHDLGIFAAASPDRPAAAGPGFATPRARNRHDRQREEQAGKASADRAKKIMSVRKGNDCEILRVSKSSSNNSTDAASRNGLATNSTGGMDGENEAEEEAVGEAKAVQLAKAKWMDTA